MSGTPQPLFVEARRILLDALDALGPQRDAVVLIGAQAVYLRVGDAGLAVAAHTTDADLAILPEFLSDAPQLGELLRLADFRLTKDVGTWSKDSSLVAAGEPVPIALDLMVPDAVGGPGRRAARIPPHGDRTARKARGIEAALYDRSKMTVRPLDTRDVRSFQVSVAGSAALLVAKLHKIRDRASDEKRNREIAKDALDVLRLLRGAQSRDVADALRRLATTPRAADRAQRATATVVREALEYMDGEFARVGGLGPRLAARAAAGAEDPEVVAASLVALSKETFAAASGR